MQLQTDTLRASRPAYRGNLLTSPRASECCIITAWQFLFWMYHVISSINIAARRRGVKKYGCPKLNRGMEKAWKLARKAAKALREQYHVERVAAFGSLLHETRFTEWSDVDIAAWGIAPDQTFRAIGTVMDLDPSFEINLVDVNTCTPSLLKAIEEEAVDL